MNENPNRIPVIIGVGQIADRPENDADGLDSVELMAEAARRANADAGGKILGRCDWLAIVPQLSFPALDPPRELPAVLGIDPARVEQADLPSGDTPVRFLSDAANAIARGDATVALIAGGEGLRTAVRRPDAAEKNAGRAMTSNTRKTASAHRQRYGLVTPTEIYPLYENASRAAWGQTLAEGQAESACIWSLMSQVAEGSEAAWLRKAVPADEIAEVTAANRMIVFPYTKLMNANAGVNQGAAVIVTSQAVAQEMGLADQAIFVGAAAAAHEPDDPLARARWDRVPGMEVSLREALAANELEPSDLDHVELYSCFPCVPKISRRLIDWPQDRPATVHGGLTFGGGPVGNYMAHAIAQMVLTLRKSGRYGLLFGNGGYCTHNHVVVIGTEPPPDGTFPQDYHRQKLADDLRGEFPPLRDDVEGPATLETYTVKYGRDGLPAYGVVMARGEDGERLIARVEADDEATIAFLTDGKHEPVGSKGQTEKQGEILYWRRN